MFEYLGSFKSIADLPIHFRWIMWGVTVFLLTVGLFGKELRLVSSTEAVSRSINDLSVTTTGDGAVSAPVQGSHNGDTSVTQNVTSTPRNVKMMPFANLFGRVTLELNEKKTLGPENLGATKQEYTASTANDSVAKFSAYIIYDNAAWAMGSADRFIKHDKQEFVDLDAFLNSVTFASDAKNFVAIVCLGTSSGYMEEDPIKSLALSDKRAVNLCGQVSARTQFLAQNPSVLGVPLGHHTDTSVGKDTKPERKQRALVIIGVTHLSGDFTNRDSFREFITGLIRKDGLEDFETSGYSQAQSDKPLHFLQLSRNVFN